MNSLSTCSSEECKKDSMCGIAGLLGFRGDLKENIEKMNRRMFHRGPDAGGIWMEEDGSLGLGHRRLSIVDLTKTGTQPMSSASGRYVMVYNGEIYNHRLLRKRLEEKGIVFRGTSDTEVLLEAFEQYGVKETLQDCKGMFAIALWDREEKKLLLTRDRVGEKPLYYGVVAGAFAFASDIACLTQIDGFSNDINREILPFYFTHGYIPAPHSIYENIYKLEPGMMLTIKAPWSQAQDAQGSLQKEAYWSMEEAARKGFANPFTGSREEAADELERLLKASIADQMIADVPVGAFLSAGIDSSTCVSLMQSLGRGQVRSFTIGMDEEAYNEADAAEVIAKHLGTKHTRLSINEQDAKDVIPNLSYMFGEPFGDSSQIPTYLVSKLTREHVTVALSGDGGDELFAGYNIYSWCDRIWGKMQKYPLGLQNMAGSAMELVPMDRENGIGLKGRLLQAKSIEDTYFENNVRCREALQMTGLSEKEARAMVKKTYRNFAGKNMNADHPIQLVSLQDMCLYHPEDILVKVDRAGMAVSLESRIPMLDKDVVEFAWTLPMKYKRQGELGKIVLRDVLYRYVPKEMMDRPKKGFSIPIKRWLKEPELRAYAEELLKPEKIAAEGILDPKMVEKIWRDYTERDIWRPQVWYLMMFEQWLATK